VPAQPLEDADMEQLTTLDELKSRIGVLAAVAETEAPFISCYVNLVAGEAGYRHALDKRIRALRGGLWGVQRQSFEAALGKAEAYLAAQLLPDARGAAIFARDTSGGGFFLPLQFAVAVPNWIAVYPTPNIYHLVELKDTYHRYVVMIATQAWVRILEVNLGSATVRAWAERPELRERVGPGWSKALYESHRHDRNNRFLEEQLTLLERLLSGGGHTHLILAGDPRMTALVRRALSEPAAAKLIDIVPASSRDAQADVVAATLAVFIEHEEQESQEVAERLIEGVRTHGLAVAGSAACLDALRKDQVDTLVLTKGYVSEPGWSCTACGVIHISENIPAACPECGEQAVHSSDVKEGLIRLAEQHGCQIELVEHSENLLYLGGVGCLLRYRADVAPGRPTA
jgi:hypothetical protein